jgi:mono/diheme cytochrome c family protein
MKKLPLRTAATLALTLTGSLALIAAAPLVVETPAPAPAFVQLAQAVPQATLMSEGGPLYTRQCAGCHGANGQGGDGPKLAGNDYVKEPGAVISQILVGAVEHGMPPFADVLNDREIAAITTYVGNSFGNAAPAATPDMVKSQRGGGM